MNRINAVCCQSSKSNLYLIVVNQLETSLHFTETSVVALAGVQAILVISDAGTFTKPCTARLCCRVLPETFLPAYYYWHNYFSRVHSHSWVVSTITYPFWSWKSCATLCLGIPVASTSRQLCICLLFSFKHFLCVETEDLVELFKISKQQRHSIALVRVTALKVIKCLYGACGMNLK